GGPALRVVGQCDPGQGAAPERSQGLHGLPLRQGRPADPRRRRALCAQPGRDVPEGQAAAQGAEAPQGRPRGDAEEGRRGEEEVPRAVRSLSRMPAGATRRRRRDAAPAVWLLSAAILAVLVVAPLAILLVTAFSVPEG